jgi:hypothetical protein
MSRGKYLSLEEARKTGQLERFAKEHPAIGDEEFFDDLLGAIAKENPTDSEQEKPKTKGE